MYAVMKVKKEVTIESSVMRYASGQSSVIVPCFEMASEESVNIEYAKAWIERKRRTGQVQDN